MKKIFVLTVLIFLFNVLYCQGYESVFGTESTQWNITIGNLWGTSSTEHHIIGDTTIDNKDYKIIDGYSGAPELLGFLRQDSLNEKAWYRNNYMDQEILIMDLSLDLGDSLYIQGVWNSSPKYYIVDSVYSKDNRKHIQFDLNIDYPYIPFDDKFTLIEGVISNMGFRYQDNAYINGFPTILLCVFKNDKKIYGDGECSFTSTQELGSISDIFTFPNPVTNNLSIKINYPISEGEIEIISINGNTKIRKSGILSEIETIDLSNLINGIYFVVLRDFNMRKVQITKIVKVSNR